MEVFDSETSITETKSEPSSKISCVVENLNFPSSEVLIWKKNFANLNENPRIKMEIILSGPVHPCGPFPKDELQNGRSFLEAYYHFIAKSGLKIDRYWLCYSEENDSVYCQPCWLFPSQGSIGPDGSQKPWSTKGLRNCGRTPNPPP